MAPIANPGQLGIMSLTSHFSSSYYLRATDWLPEFDLQGVTYSTGAVNVGINLQDLFSLPVPVSVGVGYSRISLDLGIFAEYQGGPLPDRFDEGHANSDDFTLALGIDDFVTGGIGLTVKHIRSSIADFDVQRQGRLGNADVTATDLGIILQIPVVEIISKLQHVPIILFSKCSPLFDLTFGCTRRNVGDKLVYWERIYEDPLPRTGILGMSIKLGMNTQVNSAIWEIISLTLAREAEDLLVRKFPAPTDGAGNVIGDPPPPGYQSGIGDIQPFKNLLLGERDGAIRLRKGWQVNLGEIISVRGGSYAGVNQIGNNSYTTSGYGLRLGGLVKLLCEVGLSLPASTVPGFILEHIELGFDHASETASGGGVANGTTFDALNLVVK